MKATISKADFIAALGQVAGGLPPRSSSIQALQNVLLEFRSGEGAIRATATDLEVAIVVDVPATVPEDGALAVPGAKLLESVREMPDGEISLMGADRNALVLKSGKARLTLRGIGREEYPSLPALATDRSFDVEATDLRETIRRTIIAASHDEARSFLTGAFLVLGEKKARFVATDGHRLALSEFSPSALGKNAAGPGVIIPARILSLVASALPAEGRVRVTIGETHVVFSSGSSTFSSRLIAEKFPDYQKIIPKASDRKIQVGRQEFLDVLKRVSLYTNARTSAVLLSVKSDRVVVSAETPEFGEAHDEVDAQVTGPAMDITFNARYLQDVMKVLTGEEVIVELGAKIAPAVFQTAKDKGYTYILMPLRG